ncbi:MAG: hypothetical protein HYZ50_11700 [Deltaproteobacteria bacterium]|nr:hypothetical protein [Deltaproteobacteria bacterium]
MDTFARILYQKFFLRDVVGKVAPGGIVVAALLLSLDLGVVDLLSTPKVVRGLVAPVAFACCFLAGVGLQVAGELLGLLSASPKPHHVLFLPVGWLRRLPPCAHWWQLNEDSAERLVRIRCAAPGDVGTEAMAHWEYLSALREGTGNLALALLVLVGRCVTAPEAAPAEVVVALLFSAWLLWSTQALFAKRQARFEIALLARAGLLNVEETLAMGRTMGLREDQIPVIDVAERRKR